MKKLMLSFVVPMLCLFGCQNDHGSNVLPKSEKDGVFIHISHGSGDVHRVLMGLQMASLMSEDKDVLVYFDIRGIEVVLNDAENLKYSHFPDSKTQIQKLLSNNVLLMACPGCLKSFGKSPSDLMDGVQVADKSQFFSFTKGRILTLDY